MARNTLYFLVLSATLSGCAEFATQRRDPAPTAASHRIEHPGARAEALLQALLALGIDYRRGGSSPAFGFDCSGLVAHVFREAYGMRLPQNARSQSELGVPVARDELRAGDLVFFDTSGNPYSHVGIYVGEGRFVHAPRPGARVRIESVHSGYWRPRFNGARRLDPGI